MSGIRRITGEIKGTLLDRMCDSIGHRRIQKSTRVQSEVALGIRLWQNSHIVSPNNQPAQNEQDTIWAVLDGDLYNSNTLRAELEGKGHHFCHHCTAEILIHAYEEFGLDCAARLEGPFAFAIWDDTQKKLVLGRDRLGVQPLYYAKVRETFLFGSEIKAILQHENFERKVNQTALRNYLGLLFVPGPETIFQQIYQVEPASVLAYGRRQFYTHRYWHPDYTQKMPGNLDEFCERVLHALRHAVKKLILPEASTSVMLSGGVDAGAALALAQEHPPTLFIPSPQA